MMKYYLSLGANLGNREQTIQQALKEIEQHIGHVLRCSSYYYSAPWGFESAHEFCNLCCCVETELEPMAMLAATQTIEKSLGRTHKSHDGQYADRKIDIDIILAYNQDGQEIECRITNEQNENLLTIPHPLWQERDFVKVPLAEIMQ